MQCGESSSTAPSLASANSVALCAGPGLWEPHLQVEQELPSPGVLALLPSHMQCVGQVVTCPPATLALETANSSSSIVPGTAHRFFLNRLPQRSDAAAAVQSLGLRRERLTDRGTISSTPTSNYFPISSLARISPNSGLLHGLFDVHVLFNQL